MEERTITRFLQDISRFTPLKDQIIYSVAFGPVKLVSYDSTGIVVLTDMGEVRHDPYGRLSARGQKLLYPKEGVSWEDFYKSSITAFSDSKLQKGEVCLAKKEYSSPWYLAVFNSKEEGDYIIQTSQDLSRSKYAISWADNKPLLGRCNFPEWFYDGDE